MRSKPMRASSAGTTSKKPTAMPVGQGLLNPRNEARHGHVHRHNYSESRGSCAASSLSNEDHPEEAFGLMAATREIQFEHPAAGIATETAQAPQTTAPQSEELQEIQGEKMVLNMGPSHPSTHGVLRIVLEMDGEIITKAMPD